MSVVEHIIECVDGGGFGERLAGMPVGPELAAVLASIDATAVPNGSVIEFLQACARQRAHAEAVYLAAVASVLERDPTAGPDSVVRLAEPDRHAPDEVRAALTMSRRQGWNESEFAHHLCRGLPAVHAEMLAGRIDRARALVFVRHLAGLPDDLVAKVLDAVLIEAPGLTTAQLRARILKLVITADPDHAEDAYQRALAERAVVGYLDPDGTAVIAASGLPPDEAAAATERIARLARAAKRAGHPGRADQLRADIYLRLLDGRFHHLTRAEMIAALLADTAQIEALTAQASPGEAAAEDPAGPGPRPAEPDEDCPHDYGSVPMPRRPADEGEPLGQVVGVEVRARLDSLAGINELPGELPGWGPITAETARRAVARQHHGRWRWAVTDHHGYLITEGLTRRRPVTGAPRHGASQCQAEGGIVELAIPAAALARLTRDPPPAWAGVITDISAQYERARTAPGTDRNAQPGRRLPGRALRRYVEIRDRTCTAPGCRRPATQSELDHTQDHQHGGATTSANLGPGCSYDHQLKHVGGWSVTQPSPGRFIWISPLGRRYHTRGERITDPEPEPPS